MMDLYLVSYTKINSKCVKGLTIRPKTINLLDHIGQKFHNVGSDNNFLGITPKAQETTRERDKMDFIKIKIFVHQQTLFIE